MYTHEEILELQQKVIALEIECEEYSMMAVEMDVLAGDLIANVCGNDQRWKERYAEIHRPPRKKTSAEVLLEFAREKAFKLEEEELGAKLEVVAIDWLEEWVEIDKQVTAIEEKVQSNG